MREREKRQKSGLNTCCSLIDEYPGIVKVHSNYTNIMAFFIIKIILFIYLDFGGKISIIRTALRLHDL
jgi:hypothetical protein